jgi:hypothetical protein
MYQIKLGEKSLCTNIINYTVKFSINAFYNWLKCLFTIKYSTQVINSKEISQTNLTGIFKNKGFKILSLEQFIAQIFQHLQYIPNGFQFVARRERNRAAKCTPCYMSSEVSSQQRRKMKAEGYSNNYNLLVKFMLHQGWLEKHNSVFFNIKQDKTQYILKLLNFAWSPITDEIISDYLIFSGIDGIDKKNWYFLNLESNFYLSPLIEKIFREKIEPLYGDQTLAIKKILNCKDRACDILFFAGKFEGFVIYKKALQQEFGLHDAFEIKTLLLLHPNKMAGWGRCLFQRAEDIAKENMAKYIYGTISKKMQSMLVYLKKHGWSVLTETFVNDKKVVVVFKKLIYE